MTINTIRKQYTGLIATLLLIAPIVNPVQASCNAKAVQLQVLGSGGPEIMQDSRASSSYLVWLNGKARLLVDAGGGSALHFGKSGAVFSDLDAIVFTHFHVDHSADLPAMVKSSYFGERTRDLPLFGPDGNRLMPSARDFIQDLFGPQHGAFRYLSDFIDDTQPSAYKLVAADIAAAGKHTWSGFRNERLQLSAIPVHHGPVPALAWRVDIAGHSITFSGDMNGDNHTLGKLAKNSDILVAHNAIPESATGVARNLHMPPSVIGAIASGAGVKQLVLSHRMRRTLGNEAQTLAIIQREYKGPVAFADDMECFRP
ncbi:ribonuclease BN (tRNA processing enzyme) [Thiogranum longum]|uniref:Ribonuclease BN (tRNA processing enzyme) n=1 Tax=Thiogranum longum TaxID=1537524 RepID=A0A4R1HB28_9GAMM|nr:MBL fold metallo-hydrolase [Thiogranum longum]TCK17713.1 ribonuclease BN (tRNA processing enzyme) [Thiogranum longum]